jgi:hypothetical protein
VGTLVWQQGDDIVDDNHRRTEICARPMNATLLTGTGNDATRGEAKEGADGHNKETSGPVSVRCLCCYTVCGLVLGGGQ